MRDYLLEHYGKPLVALTVGQMKDLKRLKNNDQMIIHVISPRLGLPQIYEPRKEPGTTLRLYCISPKNWTCPTQTGQ